MYVPRVRSSCRRRFAWWSLATLGVAHGCQGVLLHPREPNARVRFRREANIGRSRMRRGGSAAIDGSIASGDSRSMIRRLAFLSIAALGLAFANPRGGAGRQRSNCCVLGSALRSSGGRGRRRSRSGPRTRPRGPSRRQAPLARSSTGSRTRWAGSTRGPSVVRTGSWRELEKPRLSWRTPRPLGSRSSHRSSGQRARPGGCGNSSQQSWMHARPSFSAARHRTPVRKTAGRFKLKVRLDPDAAGVPTDGATLPDAVELAPDGVEATGPAKKGRFNIRVVGVGAVRVESIACGRREAMWVVVRGRTRAWRRR